MNITVDAEQMPYRKLNEIIRELLDKDTEEIIVKNVNGQRYIGNSLQGSQRILINGIPGNDMGVFIDGPSLIVYGNIQDGAGNTMNSGLIVVHGSAGDALGYGMRGGEVYIRDNTGYRAGIHMKEYGEKKPVLVIGGTCGDFMGEYMAGGVVVVLNLDDALQAVGNYCATGMHGGVIYIRGKVDSYLLKGVDIQELNNFDLETLDKYTREYQKYFSKQVPAIKCDDYTKIVPGNKRPYKNMYAGV